MVFIETLKKYDLEVETAVKTLFKTARINQRYCTDILLVIIHGYYDRQFEEFNKKERISPFKFGLAYSGWSQEYFYELFHFYRVNHIKKTKFLADLASERKEAVEYGERISINLELLIYLKFWESDFLLRQLYNLTNLACGEFYKWDIKQEVFTSRPRLIKGLILERLKDKCPGLCGIIEETYSNTLRNAVAHSKYYFIGRTLHYAKNNDIQKPEYGHMSFEDWEVMFHKVILLYNHIIGQINIYQRFYQIEVHDKHFGLPIYTSRVNRFGQRDIHWIKFDPHYRRWLFREQLDER